MDTRECAREDCPYCLAGLSMRGKRTGLCSMPKPLISIGCPEPARRFKAL